MKKSTIYWAIYVTCIVVIIFFVVYLQQQSDDDQQFTELSTLEELKAEYDNIFWANPRTWFSEEEQKQLQTLSGKQELLDATVKAIEGIKKKTNISYDEFQKNNWISYKGFSDYTNTNAIDLYIGKDDSWSVRSRFRIRYEADDWLFIKKYQFSINWDVYDYSPSNINTDSWNGGRIWEWSDEIVDKETLKIIKAIYENWSANIRFVGSKYNKDRALTKKEIEGLKDMYELLWLLKKKGELEKYNSLNFSP